MSLDTDNLQDKRFNYLGLAGLLFGVGWFGGVGSVLAAALGHIAYRQISQSQGAQTGRGIAVAGILAGWIGIILTTAWVLYRR